MNTESKALTLADIFLEVLEQKSNDESQKAYIRKVKTLMDVPECAEYLSFGLMNAMGNPTPIAASTVDKAVDCITHFYEDNIEENKELTREEKGVQKALMKEFINKYRQSPPFHGHWQIPLLSSYTTQRQAMFSVMSS